MQHTFDPYARNYQSLSVTDLLDAREAYHVFLNHLDNVFATAIGLFRIRYDDADATHHATLKAAKERGTKKARTFANTFVRPWSWPCVLVFVKEWIDPAEVPEHSDEIVPPFLHLPDGRVVPTCVLRADLFSGPAEAVIGVPLRSPVFGSGQPIVTRVQGEQHVGTVACIVFDGSRYYALTNQHVALETGTAVFAYAGGELFRIGKSAGRSLEKKKFSEMYRGFPGDYTFSNLDLGLVELDSLDEWTSNMHGTGENGNTAKLGRLVEFRSDTATLDWIGCKLVGFGATTGCLEGEIKALFYRYRSIAGIDYVSDFLIGDREPSPGSEEHQETRGLLTAPGDSGALWCIEDPAKHGRDPAKLLRPFAVQWGGQKLVAGDASTFTRFALATSLAVGCRELDVELVTDWNTEHTQYWGTVGHYKIAEEAIALLKGALRDFMSAHLDQITYRSIVAEPAKRDPAKEFIPLADVPDLVWKQSHNDYPFGRKGPENPNHYADLDLLDDGDKEIQSCGTDARAWLEFYRHAVVPGNGLDEARAEAKMKNLPEPPDHGIAFAHQGLLPFRIWQIFNEMVRFSNQGKATEFLCAAGVLAHYVGDSCQPLHGSRHADGLEGAATGVHSTYEELMVDAFASKIADGLAKTHFAPPVTIADGRAAAKATLKTMSEIAAILKPTAICQAFDGFRQQHGYKGKGKLKAAVPILGNQFCAQTVKCMAEGIILLASMWQSAFDLGNPGPASFGALVSEPTLQALYFKPDFLPSYYLNGWIHAFSAGDAQGEAMGDRPAGSA